MNNTIDALIKIIKAVINGNRYEPENISDIDWEFLYDFAEFHSVTEMTAYKIAELEEVPDEIKRRFASSLDISIMRDTNQEYMVSQMLEAFEKNGIECMPLKGYILKHMYPAPEMRSMCDVDVLIHSAEIGKIKEIMQTIGFDFDKESPHEYIFFAKPYVSVELHKSLVPNYNHDLFSYYGDGWRIAKKKQGFNNIYEMSFEDFYIYAIVHAAKHYLNGGTGIRQVSDIYVLQNCDKYDRMEKDYVTSELKKLGLDTFSKILCDLSNVWFGERAHDEKTLQMEEYILMSGVYGTQERAKSSRVYRESAKSSYRVSRIKIYLRMIFPRRIGLINRYPIVKDKKWTYPFVIVYRWFDVLINRRKNLSHMKEKTASDEEVNEFAKHCEAMGLRKSL